MSSPSDYHLDRRAFLRSGLIVGLAAGAPRTFAAPAESIDPKAVLNYQPEMPYRRVGRTDVFFSLISIGGYSAEPVIQYAIDRGANLVHTSLNYSNGQLIRVMAKALENRRDKVYVALKDEFDRLDDALRALGTDHIDFLMFNRHGRSAVTEPKIQDAIDKYKRQGKIRYGGLTSHGDVKAATQAGILCGMYTASCRP